MRKALVVLLALAPATIFVRARAQGESPSPATSTSPSAVTAPLPPPAPAPVVPTTQPPVVTPPPPVSAPAAVYVHPSEVVDEPKEKEKKTETDHDKVVGHFGAGYFGQYDVPLGFGASVTGTATRAPTEAAQFVGGRYWWRRVRLDVAFGWNVGSGTQTVADSESDQVSTLVLAGRIALPIAAYVGDHYTFFVGPEIAYAGAGETVPGRAPPIGGAARPADTTHAGSRLTLGGRAGAEVQFGFIGIPHLALDATVGVGLDFTSGETTAPAGTPVPGQPAPTVKAEYHRMAFRSSAQHQPWNLFFSNVAAVYYF